MSKHDTPVVAAQFYLGTTRLQLEHKGDAAHVVTNIANVVPAFGFVGIPVIGWLLDKKGYGVTLATINFLGVIASFFQAMPSLYFQARTLHAPAGGARSGLGGPLYIVPAALRSAQLEHMHALQANTASVALEWRALIHWALTVAARRRTHAGTSRVIPLGHCCVGRALRLTTRSCVLAGCLTSCPSWALASSFEAC